MSEVKTVRVTDPGVDDGDFEIIDPNYRQLTVPNDPEPPPGMMEVRCCCDAHLIGYLPAPPEGATEVSFALSRAAFFTITSVPVPVPAEEPARKLTFEVAGLYRIYEWRRAYKSRDYPIDLIRRISSFVEAKP